MKFQEILLMLGLCSTVVAGMAANAPICALKCWENSKYVSSCHSEIQCLCEDAEFQSSVLQCLYSQCQTTQFGAALHHALSECSDYSLTGLNDLPPLIRHQGLRKRERQDKPLASIRPLVSAHAGFASAQALHTVRRGFVGASVVPNVARPTRSAINIIGRTSQRALATESPLPTGLGDVGFTKSLAPSSGSTADILPSATALASLVAGSGPRVTKPLVRVAEVQPSARPIPYTARNNGTTASTNATSLATAPTASSLVTGALGYNFTSFRNTSTTGAALPHVSPSATGAIRFNGTLTYQRQRRVHWSLF